MNKRVEIVAAKTMRVVELEIPKAPPKGMVVKIHYSGVCHSDVHMWLNEVRVGDNQVVPFNQLNPKYTFPRVLGHEIAGEVYELGDGKCPDDPKFAIGERVVVFPWTGCDDCNYCTRKRENWCKDSLLESFGIGQDGGYQAYLSVYRRDLVQRVPDGIPMEVACLLTCSGLTTYNAVTMAKQTIEESIYVNDKARVLIVGAGGLGLWALQWAKALYPDTTKVYMADLTEDKLEFAKKVGADGGVLWARGITPEETKKRAEEVCGGEIDVAFDYVGHSSTTAAIQNSIRPGGMHVTIGVMGGAFPLDTVSFALTSRHMRGVFVGNSAQMAEVLDLSGKKKVAFPPVSIHQPEEADDLLQQLNNGTLAGRAVLKFI